MKKKYFVLLIIAAIGVLLLTACERSATRSPSDSAATDGEIPFPVSTQSQIMVDILAGTQTAQAAEAATGGEKAQPTAKPPEPTAKPTSMPEPEEEEDEPEPTPGLPTTYTIKENEFLFCIARRYNVDVAEFLSINGLGLDYFAQVGDRLNIPQSGTPFNGQRALRAHPTSYTVAAGDTIGKVACYFGDVDPAAILNANDLDEGAKLQPGQVLQIP